MEKNEISILADEVVAKIRSTKPDWFTHHEQSDNREFGEIKSTLNNMQTSLNNFHNSSAPMLEWFEDMNWGKKKRLEWAKSLGFWGAFIVGLSAVFGIFWAIFKFLVFNAK